MQESSQDGALNAEPLEDQGAVAEDGFGFQHDCIGRLAVQMLRDDSMQEIICETHEDAIVRFADNSEELVSCKGRTAARPWTASSVLTEGGVLHLFENWVHTGRSCRCRVMTDGDFTPGTDGGRALVEACASRKETQISPWADRLAPHFQADPAEVCAFLSVLNFHWDDLRPRAHLGNINATRLRSWLREAKLPATLDVACYSLIRDHIAQCCRASMADPLRGVSLLEASRAPADSKRRARINDRTLDRRSVEDCVREYLTAQPILDGDPTALDHTRLVIKLERGEVPEQVIALAKRLRASWFERQAGMELRAPGGDPGLQDLRTRALMVIADALAASERVEPYGREMYLTVRDTLTVDSLGDVHLLGLSDELLLGLAFQMTDECELFWSARFDVDAELS
jgi:hypothetical protein